MMTQEENTTYERVYKQEIAKTNGDASNIGRCHDLAMADVYAYREEQKRKAAH